MTDPVSTASRTSSNFCDPSVSSCAESGGAAALPAAAPAVVTIEPVVIRGDAGAQQLLERYDQQVCTEQKRSALLSCAAIGLGSLNALEGGEYTGVASAFHASVLCGKDLRSLYDCETQIESLRASARDVVDRCHEQDGVVKPGASLEEIVCEVAP